MTDMAQTFMEAVTQGDTARVAALLDQDPALIETRSGQGVSALLTAFYYGQRDMAAYLASRGAPLGIFEAVALGRVERVTELLAEQPALAHAYSPDGFQPLGYAAFFGQPVVADMLLAHGADPNSPSRNAMRVRPLHSATAAGQLGIVQSLLAHGADPNAVQENDFTPLHNAAQNGDRAMVETLLQAGAQVGARSRDGRAAVDFARESGHHALADWLEGLASAIRT